MKTKIRQWLGKISWIDVVSIGALIYGAFVMGPRWWELHKQEGEPIKPFSVTATTGETLHFPAAKGKRILIFWATWCGPCTIELTRFNRAVLAGDLPADKVVAVSMGEDPALVKAESEKRGYRFTVAVDPDNQAGDALLVSSTPTVFYLDENGTVAHASAGLSPLAIYRSRFFLHD